MIDLRTNYLGSELKNPLIVGACGLTSNLDTIQELEQQGVGAIVCKTLFEEQVMLRKSRLQAELYKNEYVSDELLRSYSPLEVAGPQEHLYWVKKVKEMVSIPVFASLNAVHQKIWLEYAKKLEQTGIDGLEINLYTPPKAQYRDGSVVEQEQISIIRKIKNVVSIPISVKISPYYTNVINFITRLSGEGVDGIVLFNRLFQPEINIEDERNIFTFTFSRKQDNRNSLKYTGLLYANTDSYICANTGIMDGDDVIKMILAGADAVQIVSTLYKNGSSYISKILIQMRDWMERKNYSSVVDFKGNLSRELQENSDNWIFKRSQYVKMLMQPGDVVLKQILPT